MPERVQPKIDRRLLFFIRPLLVGNETDVPIDGTVIEQAQGKLGGSPEIEVPLHPPVDRANKTLALLAKRLHDSTLIHGVKILHVFLSVVLRVDCPFAIRPTYQ